MGAGICYALAAREPGMLLGVVACLAVNWLGDSVDGTLARMRNRQRPRYGCYVDHMHVNGIHFTFIYFWANSGRNGCGRRAPSLRSGFQQAARTPPKRRNFDSGMRPPVRQTQGLGLRPRLFSG